MAIITLQGNTIHTYGELPKTGTKIHDFLLTRTDLSDVTLKDFYGKKILLNIFPSLDTPVCAASVRKFNAQAEKNPNTIVLCISRDLPFAHSRFCTAEGLNKVISTSELRNDRFGKDYGVLITDGPLAGLFSRAVIVADEAGIVRYTEQVSEITEEPNYQSALDALK